MTTPANHVAPRLAKRVIPRRLAGAIMTFSVAVVAMLTMASGAQAATAVGLGTLNSYGVLGGAGVTNTGPTVVNGDLGTAPTPTVTGFGGAPNGTVNGVIHQADAAAAQAQDDLTTAYNDASGQGPLNTIATELGGRVLTTGAYNSAAGTFGITGNLTLDGQGDPNAVFIFNAASTLTTATGSSVSFVNGAQSCNVFWRVGSSATLNSGSTFAGNILADQSISVNDAVTVDGRLLARIGAVTMINDTITRAQCASGDTGPVPPTPPPGGDTGPGGGDTGGTGGGGGGGGGGNGGGGPSVGITGFPTGSPSPSGRCLDKGFMARIKVRSNRPMRSVKVFVEGELIRTATRKQFNVWIAFAGLRAGTNTIKVVAVDVRGRRAVDRRNFRFCAPAVPSPDFTG